MRKKDITWQWLSAAIISLLMFSAPAFAGSLNPSAPPGPTMKTLDQAPAKDEVIPPWSQTLPANDTGDPCNSARFKCVMGGAAVLDRETGLVWEQSPDTTGRNWYSALAYCYKKSLGNRKGWRLPTVEELTSLIDPTQIDLALPSGHPFSSNVDVPYHWSATTYAGDTAQAWLVSISSGLVVDPYTKVGGGRAWCVRGGQGVDGQ